MKKIIFAAPLLALAFAACDPSTGADYTPEGKLPEGELAKCVKITPLSEGNNNFTYTTDKALPVQIRLADGTVLATGAKGSFQLLPFQSKEVVLFYVSQDGTVNQETVKLNVTNYTNVDPLYEKVYGKDFGKITWTWDTTDNGGVVWGNGKVGESTAPAWWQVAASDIDGQASQKGLPQDGLDGWFAIDCANGSKVTTSRGEEGTVTVSTKKFKEGWDMGTLTFSGTIPLMGVQVNFNNQRQYVYQILKADGGEHLYLAAPEPGAGDGGTGWFWCFKAKK